MWNNVEHVHYRYLTKTFPEYFQKAVTALTLWEPSENNLQTLCDNWAYPCIKNMFPWCYFQVLSIIVNFNFLETRKQKERITLPCQYFYWWRWKVANLGHHRIAVDTQKLWLYFILLHIQMPYKISHKNILLHYSIPFYSILTHLKIFLIHAASYSWIKTKRKKNITMFIFHLWRWKVTATSTDLKSILTYFSWS